MDHLCFLCLVFVKHLRPFIAAMWSLAGKGLTYLLSFVMFDCVFVTFSCGILGQVRYLIDSCSLLPFLLFLNYHIFYISLQNLAIAYNSVNL